MPPDTCLHWARPARPNGTGVIVLAGSSGRLDSARADMLAGHGVTALAVKWFGGEGQPAVPCEVPLETFTDCVGLLAADCERVVLMGLSYGAEAALLTAARDPRVDGVVAFAPSDVAWEGQNVYDDDPRRSKWTWQDEPVPFVPLRRDWVPERDPAFVDFYRSSREAAGPDVVARASITVESTAAEMVLVAGGDDRVWDSATHARAIEARRARHGLATTVITDPLAGHPVVLPGETPPDPSRAYQVGGDAGSAERIGAAAWPAIEKVLHLRQ